MIYWDRSRDREGKILIASVGWLACNRQFLENGGKCKGCVCEDICEEYNSSYIAEEKDYNVGRRFIKEWWKKGEIKEWWKKGEIK